MKFTISTYDHRTFTSVLWFIEKLKNNNTHHLFAGECIHHDVEDNKIIDFAAYDTDFKFIILLITLNAINKKIEIINIEITNFGF